MWLGQKSGNEKGKWPFLEEEAWLARLDREVNMGEAEAKVRWTVDLMLGRRLRFSAMAQVAPPPRSIRFPLTARRLAPPLETCLVRSRHESRHHWKASFLARSISQATIQLYPSFHGHSRSVCRATTWLYYGSKHKPVAI